MTIQNELLDVLSSVRDGDVTVSSNYAREKASVVAMAASMGLISTRIARDVFGRTWMITVGGLKTLNETELDGEY